MKRSLSNSQIRLWRIVIYFFFALPGLAFASWVARTPIIRDSLGASTAEMGWIIFGLAIGSIIGLLFASHFIAHFGGRVAMVVGLTIGSVGLMIVGIGGSWFTYGVVVFIGLAVFGFGIGLCDVAMNVEGTAVEHAVKKSILTSYHAAYSLGTLVGALIGALMIKVGISDMLHLSIIALLVVLSAIFLFRFVPAGTGQELKANSNSDEQPMTAKERMAVWKEPRTLLIGIIVLGMSFTEGSANDWLPIIAVDGYHVTPAIGSFAFALFVAIMTILRATGGVILDRFGRVAVLRASAIFAFTGLLIVIWGQSFAVASIGIMLWGIGSAFGFPVGVSAVGDDPKGVAARVGAVSTAGYISFLVGPPVLGLVGEHFGILRSLYVVLICVTIAGLLSHAVRPIDETKKTEKKLFN